MERKGRSGDSEELTQRSNSQKCNHLKPNKPKPFAGVKQWGQRKTMATTSDKLGRCVVRQVAAVERKEYTSETKEQTHEGGSNWRMISTVCKRETGLKTDVSSCHRKQKERRLGGFLGGAYMEKNGGSGTKKGQLTFKSGYGFI